MAWNWDRMALPILLAIGLFALIVVREEPHTISRHQRRCLVAAGLGNSASALCLWLCLVYTITFRRDLSVTTSFLPVLLHDPVRQRPIVSRAIYRLCG